MSVEEALDRVTRDAQQRLTDLQMALRHLCAAEDQQIDDEQDFKECVRLEDEVTDFVSGLAELLSELPQIAGTSAEPVRKSAASGGRLISMNVRPQRRPTPTRPRRPPASARTW